MDRLFGTQLFVDWERLLNERMIHEVYFGLGTTLIFIDKHHITP
jgi:hypothetical protein